MKSHQSPDLSQTLQSDWSDGPRPTFPHLGCICSSQQTIKVTDFWPTLSHVPWWPSQLQNTNSTSAHAIATFLMQKNVYICHCTLLRPSRDVSVLMKNISVLLVLYCAWRISSCNHSLTQLWHSLVLQIQATALITTIIPHSDQTYSMRIRWNPAGIDGWWQRS
jgi:hypothetical protein